MLPSGFKSHIHMSLFPDARNEKPTTNFNQDIFFLSQKGADESIVRGDASSSELLNQLATWLSGDRGKLLVRCRLGNPGRYNCENKRLKDDRCYIVFLINQWGATSVKAKLLWSTVIAGNLWEQDLLKPDCCALYYTEGKSSFYKIALETQLYGKTSFTCAQHLFKSVCYQVWEPFDKIDSKLQNYALCQIVNACAVSISF